MTNADTEKKAVEASTTAGPDQHEPTFDTGLTPWLQVFGAWFLFFNSWYFSLILLITQNKEDKTY